MPITKQGEIFMASWLLYDESNHIESTAKWRKKWDNNNDYLADFGKKKAQIDVTRKEFKSYDVPIVIHDIQNAWFFFETNDISRVEHLIATYLKGIGKKINYGFGRFDSFEIEEIDYNPFEKIIRPILATPQDILQGEKTILTGYQPPYWLPANIKLCLLG
jgi:hypothetical protein